MVWQFDPNLSKVEWAIGYLGIATIRGRFTRVQATLDLEDSDPTKWSFEATIDASSVLTGHDRMEDHIRTPDFLDVEQYPTIVFKSKRVEPAKEGYRAIGDLTLRGVTREVVLEGSYGGQASDARGIVKRGISGQTHLKRSDFGIPSGKAGDVYVAGEDVRITIEVIAQRAD
jgi:polyisoprenoid-binding protein YceI